MTNPITICYTEAMDKIEELLTRGAANIIPSKKELKKLLESGKKLNIYLGIDPTATKIHLGHAVLLRKLNTFAKLGHNVTFLIGDFTALIGDTSDKETERPALSKEQIEENFKTYKRQAEKALDFSRVKIRYNSEWLSKLSYEETIKLMQQYSLNDFIGRELIRKRLDKGRRIALHEVQYPAMQGYDSFFMDTDLQIGGTDQTFNMQAGRTLLKNWRDKESFILATEFLMGTDGRKMSKIWKNAIWLEDAPNDMYAKVMAIKDDLIIQYYTLATNVPLEEIEKVKSRLESGRNPMSIKKELAFEIVSELYNKEAAKESAENFEKTVQKKELPQEIPTRSLPKSFVSSATVVTGIVELGLASSNSEAKRLIEQGGITINNEAITNPNNPLAPLLNEDENILIRGKRNVIKVKIQ